MVKAVNKLILEINNTENEYFEKAVFYIRPEMSCSSKLRSQAELYLNGTLLENSDKKKKHGKRSFIIISVMIGAVVGVCIAAPVFLILF